MNAESEFANLYNKFIDNLLEKNTNKDEFRKLLIQKKLCSIASLLDLKHQYEKREKILNETKIQNQLFEYIGKLPQDIIKFIGSYSHAVINQKKLIRIEYYNNWFKTNKDRIIKLLKNWSKSKLGFVLDKIRSPNNPYYNCCNQGTVGYKKGNAIMFRSRIETLIEEKGQRSNMEMYSLLLAIEKYDKKKNI
jgi:hypothetical protein